MGIITESRMESIPLLLSWKRLFFPLTDTYVYADTWVYTAKFIRMLTHKADHVCICMYLRMYAECV
jgi:hypothetical protein